MVEHWWFFKEKKGGTFPLSRGGIPACPCWACEQEALSAISAKIRNFLAGPR